MSRGILKQKRNCIINLRSTQEEKNRLVSLASEKGMSLTEYLLLASTSAGPVRDYKHEKEFFQYVLKLTQEMNAIGKNINKATMAIHQANLDGGVTEVQIREFNELLKLYVRQREELSKKLEKIITI